MGLRMRNLQSLQDFGVGLAVRADGFQRLRLRTATMSFWARQWKEKMRMCQMWPPGADGLVCNRAKGLKSKESPTAEKN